MPDDEKTAADVDETEAKGDAKPKKGLPLKKYGIYAAIVVVMIFAAYFVTLKLVKPMLAGGGTATEEVREEEPEKSGSAEDKENEGHGSPSKHGSHESSENASAGNIYMIKEIIVNPAGTGGTRFLSASIGFELESDKVGDLLQEREAIVRDALITILSSHSIPDLSDFKKRERLRKLIQLRVQKLLHTEDIAAVYFTEFVLQ